MGHCLRVCRLPTYRAWILQGFKTLNYIHRCSHSLTKYPDGKPQADFVYAMISYNPSVKNYDTSIRLKMLSLIHI